MIIAILNFTFMVAFMVYFMLTFGVATLIIYVSSSEIALRAALMVTLGLVFTN